MTAEELHKQRHEELERDIAAFLAILSGMLDKWSIEIETLIQHAEQMNPLTALQYLQQRLPAELDQLGYAHLVQEVIDSYDKSEDSAYRLAEAAGIPAHDLSHIDHSDILAMKEVGREKLMNWRDAAASTIAAAVVVGSVTNTPRADIKESITHATEDLHTRFSRDMEAGLFIFDRHVNIAMFGGDEQKFLYFGPRDQRNRPFCARHVGESKTISEWDALDNGPGQPGPVSLWLGGINCRHLLVPDFAT